MEDPALGELGTTATAGTLVGNNVLFVQINLPPQKQLQAEEPCSQQCQRTWSVPDLHPDCHFSPEERFCLGYDPVKIEGSW